jgi:hypothetical protein
VWDKSFFSSRGRAAAAAREEEEEDAEEVKEVKQKAHVSDRKKPIDFAGRLGASVTDGDMRKVGFFCEACNYCSKDSADYLDHLMKPQRGSFTRRRQELSH